MQESIQSVAPVELEPMPPDNIRDWEQLPESFRDAVADRFENGIAREWNLQLERNDRDEKSRGLREQRRVPPRKVAA